MHADEIHSDAGLVGTLIAAQFPQWSDLPIEPVLPGGTVNALYRLGDDMVVRLPRMEGFREDLAGQHRLLRLLAPHLPVPIPDPVALGSPSKAFRWPWSINRWIDGEVPAFDGRDDRRLLALDLAGFVTAMRQIDPTGGRPSRRAGHLATRDASTRVALEDVRDLVDTGSATRVWDQSLRAPVWEGPPVWVHGDLLPTNLLTKDGRLAAVIDFGEVGVGDPACDLVPAWSLLGAGARQEFREAADVDEATWERGRGWALSVALPIIPYYRRTNPPFVALAMYMIAEVLSDSANS